MMHAYEYFYVSQNFKYMYVARLIAGVMSFDFAFLADFTKF